MVGILCVSLAPVASSAAAKKTPAAAADSSAVRRAVAPKAARKEAVRTLDAIRIEGEIDVPQVLFITARDYRRFRDGLGARYQPTSADVAKSIPLPSRVRMVARPE
jgi:hypothetical protein